MDNFYFTPQEHKWSDVAARVASIMEVSDQEETHDALNLKLFLPGTPILRNANTAGTLNMASCHNLQIGNSIEEIWAAAVQVAKVFKSGGGGAGTEWTKVAPKGTPLKYARATKGGPGVSTGPASFLPLFAVTGALVGSARSGKPSGMMGLLNAAHPGARDWIAAKSNATWGDAFQFDNCPPGIDKATWKHLRPWVLDRLKGGSLSTFNLSLSFDAGPDCIDRETWGRAIIAAWRNGDPGVVFLDHINADNPLMAELGPMQCVNVCTESPGWPDECCMLASIVLPRVVKKLGNWNELRRVARLQCRLLNRVIDTNHYPLPQMRTMAHDLRRIGGGAMGFADLLQREGIPFAAEEANALGAELARVIYEAMDTESWVLAGRDGGYRPGQRRNVTLMAVAPNGHISRVAGCSPSIYMDLYNSAAYAEYLKLTPRQHIEHIAAWQGVVDGSVSYTVSLPNAATYADVESVFRLAYEHKLKAISIYRDGSREGQPCKVDGSCAI